MNASVDPRASTLPPPPPSASLSRPERSRALRTELAAFRLAGVDVALRVANAEWSANDLYDRLLAAEHELAMQRVKHAREVGKLTAQHADEVRAHKGRVAELERELVELRGW